jgi:hypothetical protein
VEVPPETCEQFPDINKLCDVASCWIYEYTGILLGVRPILHIIRIKVKYAISYLIISYQLNLHQRRCEDVKLAITDLAVTVSEMDSGGSGQIPVASCTLTA